MKKIIALALTALMLISLVACNSTDSSDLTNIGDYAAPSYTYVTDKGVFTYAEGTGDTAIITGYKATTTEPHAVIVPNAVGESDDRIVVSIAKEAFREASAYVTSVKLPATVTTIESGAFHSCKALVEISIPDAVVSIGDLAFYDCTSLTSVKIGGTAELKTIGNYAFANCTSLENFTFSENIESIGIGAFQGSAIKAVKLPESVSSIGAQAFIECENLNYEGCITLTANVTNIGKYAFSTDVEFISFPSTSYLDKYFGVEAEEETTTEETTEEATTEENTDAAA